VFGRKGDGYIALTSRNPMRWKTEGEDKNKELIADGLKNIWICELGRKADSGSFDTFVTGVASARIEFVGQMVSYDSPSQGNIEFGWNGPLKVAGDPVSLADYARYDNPFCNADFAANEIRINRQSQRLVLDLEKRTRKATQTIT
jgi:hypothetical protein